MSFVLDEIDESHFDFGPRIYLDIFLNQNVFFFTHPPPLQKLGEKNKLFGGLAGLTKSHTGPIYHIKGLGESLRHRSP